MILIKIIRVSFNLVLPTILEVISVIMFQNHNLLVQDHTINHWWNQECRLKLVRSLKICQAHMFQALGRMILRINHGWKDKEDIHWEKVLETLLIKVSYQDQVHTIKITQFYNQKEKLHSVKIPESNMMQVKLQAQAIIHWNQHLQMFQSIFCQTKIDFFVIDLQLIL